MWFRCASGFLIREELESGFLIGEELEDVHKDRVFFRADRCYGVGFGPFVCCSFVREFRRVCLVYM